MTDEPRKAIVIDISDRFQRQQADQPPAVPSVQGPDGVTLTMTHQPREGCQHTRFVVDEEKHTVECGDCHDTLDPVWCLMQFYRLERSWNQQIDHRLAAIREHDQRERRKEELQKLRKHKPAAHRRRIRQEALERAAYNEYEAKRLMLRAARQVEHAEKIDQELSESVVADFHAAGARADMKGDSK